MDLIGLVDEILAEHRQGNGGPGGGKIFRRALEERSVGQHGETGGAAGLIGARQGRRIEVGRIRPLDGLAFLISAISAGRPERDCPLDRSEEPARARRGFGARLEFRNRHGRLGRRDLRPLARLDLLEDVGGHL